VYTNRLLSHVLAVLLPIAAAPVLAGPAHADHGSESHARAQFLSGSLLELDLSTVAGIELDLSTVAGIDGASADYRDGHTPGTQDSEDVSLELTVDDLLQLGVVNQKATALREGDSHAATSAATAALDLMALLPPTPALSTANLSFGAVGSAASIEGASDDLTRTTTIAELKLNLRSPLVADLTGTVNTAVSLLTTQVNSLEPGLMTTLDQAVDQVLALVGSAGVATASTTVDIDTTRLDQAIAGVLDRTVCTGLVCVDLTNGVITVDLAGGLDLNNLAPNTKLTDVLAQVSSDVEELLAQVQAELNEIMTNALDHVDVTIDSDTTVTDPLLGTDLGGLTIDYTGTLRDLVDGSPPLTVAGTGATGTLLTPLLTQATTLVQDAIVGTIDTMLGSAVADAGDAVNALVTDLASVLDPVLDSLAGVTLNKQNESDGMTTAATVTAVAIDILTGPLTGGTLDLATSSVGPNAFAPITPTTPTPPPTDPPGNTPTDPLTDDPTAPTVDTASTSGGKAGNVPTPTADTVLPATGSPFGNGVLVILVLLGMGMIAAGASMVRPHRV